ncbi:MAG: hypothetical protein KHZ64_08400, partial [Neisseria mucosa]|nr:hypothetical protein [Neisseria mucosa]
KSLTTTEPASNWVLIFIMGILSNRQRGRSKPSFYRLHEAGFNHLTDVTGFQALGNIVSDGLWD